MSNHHITEAKNWLRHAENTPTGQSPEQLGFAQAEALLAIAEELRTANLITWYNAHNIPSVREGLGPQIEDRLREEQ